MTFSAMLGDVLGGAAMSEAESRDFVGSLMDGGLSHVQAAALLTAVAARGDRLDEVEASIGFDLVPGHSGIETELPRGVHKILLQHLQGNHPCSLRLMLQDQLQRPSLL